MRDLWNYIPIFAMLLLGLWIWYSVMIEKLERTCQRIERERDQWKRLAFTLMAKCGIDIPADLLPNSTSLKKEDRK